MNKYALAEACACTQSKRDGEHLELKCASDVMFLPQHVCLLIAVSPHITLCLMIASSGGCLIRETSPQSQCILFFFFRPGLRGFKEWEIVWKCPRPCWFPAFLRLVFHNNLLTNVSHKKQHRTHVSSIYVCALVALFL